MASDTAVARSPSSREPATGQLAVRTRRRVLARSRPSSGGEREGGSAARRFQACPCPPAPRGHRDGLHRARDLLNPSCFCSEADLRADDASQLFSPKPQGARTKQNVGPRSQGCCTHTSVGFCPASGSGAHCMGAFRSQSQPWPCPLTRSCSSSMGTHWAGTWHGFLGASLLSPLETVASLGTKSPLCQK